jgi:hypothetical protein
MTTRRIVPAVLIALGTLLTFLAIFTIWISRQALETDQWTETSTTLLEKPAIRTAVAGYLTDQLYDNVDVAGELRAGLPTQLQVLAGPAAGALRNGVDQAARKALGTAKLQQAWESSNRASHALLVKVVDGGGPAVGTEGGVVTLDLKALLTQLQATVGVGGRVADKLPESAAKITILKSSQLHTVQRVAKALKPLAALFVLLGLVCFGSAIALARERRREMLRAAGWGFLLAGVGALAARKLLGGTVVDSLASTASVRPAVEDTWSVATSLLVDVAVAAILYGAVVVAGTWFSGPTRAAVSVRSRVAPYLREPRFAYGGLAAVFLLLLIWAPTEAFRRILPLTVLLVLMLIGTEALRRQAAREVEAAEARSATLEVDVDGPAALAGMLAELEDLHRRGGLGDDEYEAARGRVLTRTGSG